ncbi:MAG: xanthine dehydrogenase family protein molybdopterin-binding subunit [Acidobacteria bacterium]|nr:xanthine dehydrogenase family protein molybdopterin-binding subunit [Acidobacteriota bacterium]
MPLSRRAFVVAASTSGAGILIGVRVSGLLRLARENEQSAHKPVPSPFVAWVHVKPTGEISLIVAKSEMGQGIRTGLAIPLAEEAEVSLNQVSVEQAETRPDIYTHMGTGGSHSTRQNYMPYRRVGATVRELMITAAAVKWNVPREQCFAREGAVLHRSSTKKASYGELVEAASKLPLPNPARVPLKKESEFRLIGHEIPRVDIPAKINGRAQFGLDVRVQDMLFAVIARCPTFGGKPAKFDAGKAKAMAGVRGVFEIPALGAGKFTAGGIAVVADSTWQAMQARRALEINWDHGLAISESSETLSDMLKRAASKPGKRLRNDGDVDAALSATTKHIEAVYELPFQAHATMEPMNITIHRREGGCEVWVPTQSPDWVQRVVADTMGLDAKKVVVHTTFMGGGFGRRYMPDYPAEAAQIAKEIDRPVQLLWTREDDMTHDFYRPASCHRLQGTVDEHGRAIVWSHTLASTSINGLWHPEQNKPEDSEIGGAKQMPYAIPNVRLEFNDVPTAVPRAWWRSVEHSFNGFVVESFIDELAAEAHRDPVEFRRSLLVGGKSGNPADEDDPNPQRLLKVLNVAAEKSGWGKPLPKGWGRGIAVYFSFGSYFGEVAEVSVSQEKALQIHRIVAAVDCGTVVNPEGVRAQTESAIIYGLSAALKNAITFKRGAIEQSNFTDYDPIRINEAPPIEVHLAPSGDDCGGMGEPALPPLAPAIANAIYAATGQRLRKLPFQLSV